MGFVEVRTCASTSASAASCLCISKRLQFAIMWQYGKMAGLRLNSRTRTPDKRSAVRRVGNNGRLHLHCSFQITCRQRGKCHLCLSSGVGKSLISFPNTSASDQPVAGRNLTYMRTWQDFPKISPLHNDEAASSNNLLIKRIPAVAKLCSSTAH